MARETLIPPPRLVRGRAAAQLPVRHHPIHYGVLIDGRVNGNRGDKLLHVDLLESCDIDY
jgi:hypothetical protein